MFVYIHIHTTSPWLRRPAPGIGHNRSLRPLSLSSSLFHYFLNLYIYPNIHYLNLSLCIPQPFIPYVKYIYIYNIHMYTYVYTHVDMCIRINK